MNDIISLVTLNSDNTITTTSKKVAEKFNKKHDTILKACARMKTELDKVEVGQRKIRNSSYISEQNKTLNCYEMDRDGFTLVAMGLTGKEATQWKIQYINAFNQMEAILKMMNQAPSIADLKDQVEIAEAEAALEAVKEKALMRRIANRLETAKMMGVCFDVNDFINSDSSQLPATVVMDIKMMMGKEIATYGTLDMERETATAQLKKHGIDMTATVFNRDYLITAGLLSEDREITAKGRYFGCNDVMASNGVKGKVTAPHWFTCRFPELLDYLRAEYRFPC